MAVKVGELYELLTLEDKATPALGKAESSLKSLGAKLGGVGSLMTKGVTVPIVAGAAAVGGALMKAASDTGAYAESIMNLQQVSGLSTDRLQVLKYTAEQVGVSFEGVTNASAMIQQKLMGVEQDSGMAAEAIKRLGINVYDSSGQLRSMDAVFPELVAKLQGMTNETERNMLAAQVFGRGWREVAPLLGMTQQQMAAFEEEARKMGLVMGGDALTGAADFDDALWRLQQSFTGMWRSLAVQVMPILQEDLLPFLQDTIIPAIGSMAKAVGNLIQWFANLPGPVQTGIAILGGLLVIAGPILSFVSTLITILPALTAVFGGVGAAASAAWIAITGPIALVIAAVAAVIAIGVLLWKNWEKMSVGVKLAITALMGPFGMLLMGGIAIVKNWDFVKKTGLQAWSYLKSGAFAAIRAILGYYEKLVGFIPGLGQRLRGAMASLDQQMANEREARSDRESDYAIKQAEDEAKKLAQAEAKMKTSATESAAASTATATPGTAGAGQTTTTTKSQSALSDDEKRKAEQAAKELAAIKMRVSEDQSMRMVDLDAEKRRLAMLQAEVGKTTDAIDRQRLQGEVRSQQDVLAYLTKRNQIATEYENKLVAAEESQRDAVRSQMRIKLSALDSEHRLRADMIQRDDRRAADALRDSIRAQEEAARKKESDEKKAASEAASAWKKSISEVAKSREEAWENDKARALQNANAFLMYNKEYVEGVKAGLREAEGKLKSSGWFGGTAVAGAGAVSSPGTKMSMGDLPASVSAASSRVARSSASPTLGTLVVRMEKDGGLKAYMQNLARNVLRVEVQDAMA